MLPLATLICVQIRMVPFCRGRSLSTDSSPRLGLRDAGPSRVSLRSLRSGKIPGKGAVVFIELQEVFYRCHDEPASGLANSARQNPSRSRKNARPASLSATPRNTLHWRAPVREY